MSVESLTALVLCSYLLSLTKLCAALDTMSTGQSITGNTTMVSADGSFELGFFSPGDSRTYLGIWYKKISVKTVAWVASRKNPLTNSSGTLQLTDKGLLVLVDHNETIVWSSNSSRLVRNPIAQLLDSGNLVVRDANDKEPENFLWQSFDYPGNTLLPNMKLGRDIATGFDRFLTSWKDTDDPSPGNFTYRVEPNGYPQLILLQGSEIKFRAGSWNGLRFTGSPNAKENPIFKFEFVLNEKEMYYYYTYRKHNSSVITRKILNSNGEIERFMWIEKANLWNLYLTAQIDHCDGYALCGAYGSCSVENSPICGCLRLFVPKFRKEWDMIDWSNGCVRRAQLNCSNDIFLKYSHLKLPDTRSSWFNRTMNLDECEMVCKKNCNCTAYANLDIREGGSGCLLWFGELIDIREYNENGQHLYIRMAASEAGEIAPKPNQKKLVAIIVCSVSGTLMLMLGLVLMWRIKNKKKRLYGEVVKGYNAEVSQREDLELPVFDFQTIAAATNNFSVDNKLG